MDDVKEAPDRASKERAAAVAALKKGAHIHLSAICGTGMASVAALLKSMGFRITGTDKAFYPPMGDVVRETADVLFEGYRAENLSPKPDLVVIGNNLMRNNPEVQYVLENGIPYASMPEVFAALLIGERSFCPASVVVTGTHGKTTTSAAVAWMLESAGLKPGYFIGGMPKNFSTSVRAVDASLPVEKRTVVLEGDEYDSAFFAKWPKFHSYRPDIAIVTSVEFDHADIYNNVGEIEREFTKLANKVPASGLILVCDQGAHAVALGRKWRDGSLPVAFYGLESSSPFRIIKRTAFTGGQRIEASLNGTPLVFETSMTGEHNALNLLAAAGAGVKLGLSPQAIAGGLKDFAGVLRRQHRAAEKGGVILIEDFAHHPTAIDVTLRGLRETFPANRIIAVYEPRSNTSRRAFFQQDYPRSFSAADEVVLLKVVDAGNYSGTSAELIPLDAAKVVADLIGNGKKAAELPSVSDIESYLLATMRSGDVIVCMSNGDFGGLVPSLAKAINRRG